MKAKITIPKEKQDCKDGKCGHEHEHIIELPESAPQPSTIEIMGSPQQQLQQLPPLQVPPTPEQPKKLSHEEMAELIPKGINEVKCKGSDCGHAKLKNPKQTKKYKTCPNCSANTLPKGSDSCPYCTKAIKEDEDLEDGIELEDDDD